MGSRCEAVAETGDSACCFFSRALGCNIKVGANRSQDASDSAFATECKLQTNRFRLEICGYVFDECSGSYVLLTFCCCLGIHFWCGIKKEERNRMVTEMVTGEEEQNTCEMVEESRQSPFESGQRPCWRLVVGGRL